MVETPANTRPNRGLSGKPAWRKLRFERPERSGPLEKLRVSSHFLQSPNERRCPAVRLVAHGQHPMGEGGQRPGEGASSLATRPSPLAPPSGRPYFVMELVKGIRITDYCDQNDLPTEDRLKLFMKVCHAVQHAHQKGIIHRDLKPSNMMVTLHDGEAVPKVIDFGIAKATGQRLTDKTLFTRYEQMIGTPAYMSPEQAAMSGLDVDTRTDIYALGVLLYELLTGVTPFDKETLTKAAFDEIRRLIQEAEPAKPSTRVHALGDKLTDVAKHRQTEPGGLRRSLRGDLDWIVMKALEKDRRRRYETANDLAEDLERHLEHQPVVAGPPSTAYRARKFIRRHRLGVAFAAAVMVALALGLVTSLMGFAQARHERDRSVPASPIGPKANRKGRAPVIRPGSSNGR